MTKSEDKVNQFALPHEAMGRLAGWLMVIGNADMERRAVAALDLARDEAVLEVGFGPGVGIRVLARRLPSGLIAGVDPSPVMLEQATRRNRRAVREDRVDLQLGTTSELPWEDSRFDAACSVNNIQEWPSLDSDLAEIARVLKPRGRYSIAVHEWVAKYAKDRGDPSHPWDTYIAAALTRAGFSYIDVSKRRALSGRALFFRGWR